MGSPSEVIRFLPKNENIKVPEPVFSGDLDWVRIGGTSDQDRAVDIAHHPDGGIVFAANPQFTPFRFETAPGIFASITPEPSTSHYIYLGRYDASGTLKWFVHVEALLSFTHSVSTSEDGSIYHIGISSGETTFEGTDSNPITLNEGMEGGFHFIAKYDFNGSLLWVRDIGVSGGVSGLLGVAAKDGGCFLTGSFNGGVVFAPGEPSEIQFVPFDSEDDSFIAKYDPEGAFQWAKHIVGPFADRVSSISVAPSGDAVLLGYFFSTVTFAVGEINQTVLTGPSGGSKTFLVEGGEKMYQLAAEKCTTRDEG